jgi:16S rRNA (cytosine967-C5)-methyltransferase
MYAERRLSQVLDFLSRCSEGIPLHRQFAAYFSGHRSMGSRDRKELRSAVYSYFRLGRALRGISAEERLAVAGFLCDGAPASLSELLLKRFGWDLHFTAPLEERLRCVSSRYPGFNTPDIFPFSQGISSRIPRDEFIRSMLIQPSVWIRVRSRFRERVEKEFRQQGFSWKTDESHPLAWSFAAATALQETESFREGWFEIQDLASQRIGDYFRPLPGQRWWDACAASGGKSLLLLEQESGIDLVATDVRPSILENYRSRLKKSGFGGVNCMVADLSSDIPFTSETFDAVLADVPCSGSGTWSRTPEMLSFFDEKEINTRFVPLQRAILENVFRSIKKGGKLVFSTCSVFKAENEDNTEFLIRDTGGRIESESYIFGAPKGGGSMYVSVIIKD